MMEDWGTNDFPPCFLIFPTLCNFLGDLPYYTDTSAYWGQATFDSPLFYKIMYEYKERQRDYEKQLLLITFLSENEIQLQKKLNVLEKT